MALAMAYDEAKKNQRKIPGDVAKGGLGDGCHTPFFGSRNNPDLPLASLNQHNQGYFNGTHFHTADQFQVIIEGEGKLGRHGLAPYVVHFTRAYTPYGPIVSNEGHGLTFFVMRTHAETGAQYIPEELNQLQQVRGRQPWQISCSVTIPRLQSDSSGADSILQAVPGLKDEQGLAAYALNMKAHAKAQGPDPSKGDGQYLVVMKGSLLYQNNEHKAPALVFVYPTDGPLDIHAGPEGLEAIALNFPVPATHATDSTPNTHTSEVLKTWQCALCSFVYDEATGIPEEGIAPGTRWQDVPESWSCPDCSASKIDFQMKEPSVPSM